MSEIDKFFAKKRIERYNNRINSLGNAISVSNHYQYGEIHHFYYGNKHLRVHYVDKDVGDLKIKKDRNNNQYIVVGNNTLDDSSSIRKAILKALGFY